MKSNKDEILLSIIVPVYNVEKYIEQCMDSILSQNCNELEVVLVDDGSPDRSPQICDDYANNYQNVKVIHKKNGGLVSARKTGVCASKGKYITFIDSDDWIGDGYLSKIISIIKNSYPKIISVTSYFRVESNGEVSQRKESSRTGLYNRMQLETEVFPEILYKKPYYTFGVTPSIWLKVVERDLLISFIQDVPNCITRGEDLCISLPVLLSAESVYFSNVCGYYYRMNPTSITHSYDPKSIARITILLNYLEEIVATYEEKYQLKSQLKIYSFQIVSTTLISHMLGTKNLEKVIDDMELLINKVSFTGKERKEIPVLKRILLILAKSKKMCILKFLKNIYTLKMKLSFK